MKHLSLAIAIVCLSACPSLARPLLWEVEAFGLFAKKGVTGTLENDQVVTQNQGTEGLSEGSVFVRRDNKNYGSIHGFVGNIGATVEEHGSRLIFRAYATGATEHILTIYDEWNVIHQGFRFSYEKIINKKASGPTAKPSIYAVISGFAKPLGDVRIMP